MRILHVGASIKRETTNGVNRAVTSIAVAQALQGHAVAALSIDGSRQFGGSRQQGAEIDGVQQLRISSLLPAADPRVFREIATIADAFDIVHFHSAFVLAHALAGLQLRRPYVVSPHGAYAPAALARSRIQKSIFRIAVDRRYLRRAFGVHCLTEDERVAVEVYADPMRSVVIGNPIEPPLMVTRAEVQAMRAELGVSSGEFVVTYIGRLAVYQKGLDLLTAALTVLPTRGRPITLVLAGPRVATEGRLSLPPTLQLRRTVLLPPVFGRRKAALLAVSDAFAQPSRHEGMPTGILEALGHGVPVLTTAASGLASTVENFSAGVIVSPDSRDIARGLTWLRDQHWSHEVVRQRTAGFLDREHSANSIATHLMAFYRGALT